MSLGAGETTVMRMVTGYSMLANGGKRIKPTLIDRIQDRWGQTIYRHDERQCLGCDAPKFDTSQRAQTGRQARAGARSAHRLSDHLDHGRRDPARHRHLDQAVGNRHLAGKTGTTNDAKDLWFVGFSPDLAVGVFIGYDKPRSMGDSAQAATYAAPIFRDFMKMALKDKPDTPFRVPPGIKLISVDVHSGMRSSGSGAILEAFKPGTAPPDTYGGGHGGGGGLAGRGRLRRSVREPAGSTEAFTVVHSLSMCGPPFLEGTRLMRAEAVSLVEQIKQSVGLLRRHL